VGKYSGPGTCRKTALPAPGHHRVVILAQDNDDVIKVVVVTPHFLVAGGKRKLDEAIVIG
jgi:hypothetical protein